MENYPVLVSSKHQPRSFLLPFDCSLVPSSGCFYILIGIHNCYLRRIDPNISFHRYCKTLIFILAWVLFCGTGGVYFCLSFWSVTGWFYICNCLRMFNSVWLLYIFLSASFWRRIFLLAEMLWFLFYVTFVCWLCALSAICHSPFIWNVLVFSLTSNNRQG